MEPPGRPGRRGRTGVLIAGAAALGVVAGVCTGYVVQAGRPPTTLPSLSQPVVGQTKGEVEALSAAQDHRVTTDGDLRTLLLKRPRGARDAGFTIPDGWMDIAAVADTYDGPAAGFSDELYDEFRRAATVHWQIGDTYAVEIRLVQYRQEERAAASRVAGKRQAWANGEDAGSWVIPGTSDGWVYVFRKPETHSGYLPQYMAEAMASRGDILMDIWIVDSKPVPEEKIMELAKRQVARL